MNTESIEKEAQEGLLSPLLLGIVGLVFGAFLFIGGQWAGTIVGLAATLYLLIDGAWMTIKGIALRGQVGTTVSLIRGIIGLVVGGLILFLHLGLETLSYQAGFTILAIGLIAFGALGIYTGLFEHGRKKVNWGAIAVNALLVLWGILIFVSRAQEWLLQRWSAVILIAIGVIGIVYALVLSDEELEEAG